MECVFVDGEQRSCVSNYRGFRFAAQSKAKVRSLADNNRTSVRQPEEEFHILTACETAR